MQIVIELDDKTYNTLFPKVLTEMSNKKGMYWLLKLHSAVCKGTILPAGHGRLIDVDEFIQWTCTNCDGWCDKCDCDCKNCPYPDERCEFIRNLDDWDVLVKEEEHAAGD